MGNRTLTKSVLFLAALLICCALIGAAYAVFSTAPSPISVSISAVEKWDGTLALDTSAVTWFEDSDCRAFITVTYSDESTNAPYPGVAMTRSAANTYTTQTDPDKTISSVQIVRMNNAGTYMYNKATIAAANIPADHTIALAAGNLTNIGVNSRTPYYAYTFKITWANFSEGNAVPRVNILYTDNSEYTTSTSELVKTETDSNTYTMNWNAIIDPNKTMKSFRLLRCDPANPDIIWNESPDRTSLANSRYTTISTMNDWSGALTLDTSAVSWFETDNCRANIFVTYSDSTTNAAYPGEAMTRTKANTYTYSMNPAKAVSSIVIIRMNGAGTYMYNKTGNLPAVFSHKLSLAESAFSTISVSNRTPYYALTFKVTWADFAADGAVPRATVLYADGTELTTAASALVKTEADSETYTMNFDAIVDPNKTVSKIKLLRCDPTNNDIVWNESSERNLPESRITTVSSMSAWTGALTLNTSSVSWFETDNCRANIFVTYSDNSTNAAYPGVAMTRSSANNYTYSTDSSKAVSSIVFIRTNNAGTYLYNKTESLPYRFSHKFTFAETDLAEIAANERTPSYALTFNVTWSEYAQSGSVLRAKILYSDETSVTTAAGAFAKTETSSNTYTIHWNNAIDANKTISSFKLLRCDSTDPDTVLHESQSFTTSNIGASRILTVSSMSAPIAPDTFETIYYYNSNGWSSVKAYAWSGSGANTVDYLEAFPGTTMTAVSGHDGWWSISVNTKAENVIFSNGSDQTDKTSDLTLDFTTPYHKNGVWTADLPWDGVFTVDLTKITWFEDDDCRAFITVTYSDDSTNALYPGVAMTRTAAGVYTVQTDTAKTISKVVVVQMNNAGTYMYHKTGNITSIPETHTLSLTSSKFNDMAASNRTPYYALTFNVTWSEYSESGSVLRVRIFYSDETSVTTAANALVKTEADSNTYTIHWNNAIDANKTISSFKLLRCDATDPDTVLQESSSFTTANITSSRRITVDSMAEPVIPDTFETIYYYNSNGWSTVKAYAWSGSDASTVDYLEAFPGTAMTAVSGHSGWFSASVNTKAESIIFSNGSDQTDKTSDLTLDFATPYYKYGVWTADFPWDGTLTVNTSQITWFEDDDCRAFITVTYSDESTNAPYPGAAMTRVSAGVYTYLTDETKTISSVQIVRMNNAGTYMYNQTAIAAANIPADHTITLASNALSNISTSNRTPYYALTFKVTWDQTFSADGAVPRVNIQYTDGTELTTPASALSKTETSSETYTMNFDAIVDPNKTVSKVKLLRCDPTNNDIVWNESSERNLPESRITTVSSMSAWTGALTLNTSSVSWFETDNCRAHIFVTYSDNTTNAAYPGEAMTRSSANTYSYSTDPAKAVSSIAFIRTNNAGTYLYNKTSNLPYRFSHKYVLAETDLTEIPTNERTPSCALTFNVTWSEYVQSGSVLRVQILYGDSSSVTTAAGSLVKTEADANVYTIHWNNAIDANKTISSFKLLRCSSSAPDTVLHESDSFTPSDIGASRVIAVSSMTSTVVPDTFETIYYYNENNWPSVKAYAWSGSGANTVNYLEAFPGTAMTAVSGHEKWFSVSVNTKAVNVIFSNGSNQNNKTNDLTLDFSTPYYKNGAWTEDYPWEGLLTVNTSAVTWFEDNDCRAHIVITYSDESTNAPYPGAAMTRAAANVYTVQTDLTKTISSVQIVRMNNAGTYMYNQTAAIAAANIPANHTIALASSALSDIASTKRTPYYALTFKITWANFADNGAVPRVNILYTDGTEVTTPASALVKTETDSETYTIDWNATLDPNKTVSKFKLLRCDPANNDIVWNESTDRDSIGTTRTISIPSMDAWTGALTLDTSAVTWFEADNCRANIFVTYSDNSTNAPYPGAAMTRTKANTYTYSTDAQKAVSSVVIVRMNAAGTYMFNKTSSLPLGFTHKLTLSESDLTEISANERTPYYALTFKILWGGYTESGSVLRLAIDYTDSSSVTTDAGAFVKTETDGRTYTINWDSVRNLSKTVSSFKLLRCDETNVSTVLQESAAFTPSSIGSSRILSVASMSAPAGVDTFETIYYYNSNGWNSVKAYAWSGTSGNETKYLGDWAGTAMTAVGEHENWFSVSVNTKAEKIIFSNGSNQSQQTDDLTISFSSPYYKDGVWTADYPAESTTNTVYYHNENGWGSVYAYAWGDGNTPYLGGWPGTAMTADSTHTGWYFIDVDKRATQIIFSNNGSNQTGDLAISSCPTSPHQLVSHSAQPATCTSPGYAAYQTCSLCDYSTYAATPALGHDYVLTSTTPATCIEYAQDNYACSRCSDAFSSSAGGALGSHVYEAYTCKACQRDELLDYTTEFSSRGNNSSTLIEIGSIKELAMFLDYMVFNMITTNKYFSYPGATTSNYSSILESAMALMTAQTWVPNFYTMTSGSTIRYFRVNCADNADFSFSKVNTITPDDYDSRIYPQQDFLRIAPVGAARSGSFNDFPYLSRSNTVSVTTSDQLFYAFSHGYKPIPVSGSAAEAMLNIAKEINRSIITDQMTDVQKLYAILQWMVEEVGYDYGASDASDQASFEWAHCTAWSVEGVFIYKKAICDGIAKAVSILAGLEDIKCIRVIGDEHAWNRVWIDDGSGVKKWFVLDTTHANLESVIPTDSSNCEILNLESFLISDATKTDPLGYTADNYAESSCAAITQSNPFSFVHYGTAPASSSNDLVISSDAEFGDLIAVVLPQIQSASTVTFTFDFFIESSYCASLDTASSKVSSSLNSAGYSGRVYFIRETLTYGSATGHRFIILIVK
ncbi:MAG: starch-binding protein [Clostridia bacterium]|nr:starch-binding protein [Clostridia bacterium]